MVITRERLPQFKRWLNRMIKHQHELIKGMQVLVLSLEDAYLELDNAYVKKDISSHVAIPQDKLEKEVTDLGKRLKEIEELLSKYVNEEDFEILDTFEEPDIDIVEEPTVNFRRKKEL